MEFFEHDKMVILLKKVLEAFRKGVHGRVPGKILMQVCHPEWKIFATKMENAENKFQCFC